MTTMSAPSLTGEQQAVIDLPWDAKCLVVAGAGTGKTHTVVRRLDALVERDELLPGEILVLSFSRAAVRELRERIARHAYAADRVRVQTFDGWATALLSAIAPAGEWTSVPFDERIRNATEAIEDGLLPEFLPTGDLAHVVIDEVQDLVGDRSRMVEALLDSRRDAGFTVVGDPAQSVYGFQVPLVERATEVNGFFPWLRNSFSDSLHELHLTQNFRARTESARTALPFGPLLQRDGLTEEDYKSIHTRLRAALLGNLPFFPLDSDSAAAALRHPTGTCAVLCGTNGQALTLSGLLRKSRVPHRVQRSADARVLPAWIGLLYRHCEGSTVNRGRFDDLVPSLGLPRGADNNVLWQALVRLDGRGHRSGVDLNRLKAGLATGRTPDELMTQDPARVVISTVHRAKGLEFDRVIVIDPGVIADRGPEHTDPAAEARALYVSMTRPRTDLNHVELRHDWRLRKDEGHYLATRRWYRGGSGARRGQRYAVEILGGDVCRERPAGANDIDADPVELQRYLTEEVRPGAAVEFVRIHDLPQGQEQSPPYALMHRGRSIGTASETLRRHLYIFRRTRTPAHELSWPRAITDLSLDTVETVVGSDNVAIAAGLGDRGVWLAPRPIGLGRFEWDGQTAEDGGA
ncbi:UvrD-helicase domain-containing protein [Streptomyces sp. NPDC047082]|uniref:UvrD-helicase domain-containing protein n=1 Tax=Streptomyces sp. NPDC047082 TaxID=3155259 RepID=UPI0033DB3808